MVAGYTGAKPETVETRQADAYGRDQFRLAPDSRYGNRSAGRDRTGGSHFGGRLSARW